MRIKFSRFAVESRALLDQVVCRFGPCQWTARCDSSSRRRLWRVQASAQAKGRVESQVSGMCKCSALLLIHVPGAQPAPANTGGLRMIDGVVGNERTGSEIWLKVGPPFVVFLRPRPIPQPPTPSFTTLDSRFRPWAAFRYLLICLHRCRSWSQS